METSVVYFLKELFLTSIEPNFRSSDVFLVTDLPSQFNKTLALTWESKKSYLGGSTYLLLGKKYWSLIRSD